MRFLNTDSVRHLRIRLRKDEPARALSPYGTKDIEDFIDSADSAFFCRALAVYTERMKKWQSKWPLLESSFFQNRETDRFEKGI